MTEQSGDVTDAFRRLALPELRDWLRSNRTGPATYPLLGYGDFVAELTLRYLHGWGWMSAPLCRKARQMVDGIHIAAQEAVGAELAGREGEPLDPYSRGIAAKYAGDDVDVCASHRYSRGDPAASTRVGIAG